MTSFHLYLGADHAGFALKEQIKTLLEERDIDFTDLSPRFVDGDDYPVHARKVANAVRKGKNGRGILVCGSGVGMAIAANRLNGVRAVHAHFDTEVEHARQDNDVNVLTLSGQKTKATDAIKLIEVFLKAPFSTAARHHRRVKQLK